MKKAQIWISAVLYTLIIVVAIVIFADIQIIKSPKTDVEIKVVDITADKLTLEIQMKMHNPNSFDVSIEDFKVLRITNSELGLVDQSYILGEVLLVEHNGNFEMHHNIHKMRLFSPLEISAFIESAGFKIIEKYANYNYTETFEDSNDSDFMVIVAKKS